MLRQLILNRPQKVDNSPRRKSRRRTKTASVDWQEAKDIKFRIARIIQILDLDWIDPERIFCFRSTKSTARAYARIWGLSQIWQQALQTKAAYCVEVLSENFDSLSDKKKDEILIHELVHIPETFSGSLRPHMKRGKWRFHDTVDDLVAEYHKLS